MENKVKLTLTELEMALNRLGYGITVMNKEQWGNAVPDYVSIYSIKTVMWHAHGEVATVSIKERDEYTIGEKILPYSGKVAEEVGQMRERHILEPLLYVFAQTPMKDRYVEEWVEKTTTKWEGEAKDYIESNRVLSSDITEIDTTITAVDLSEDDIALVKSLYNTHKESVLKDIRHQMKATSPNSASNSTTDYWRRAFKGRMRYLIDIDFFKAHTPAFSVHMVKMSKEITKIIDNLASGQSFVI